MRIGVNALYLIPGGVGGTEIYLRSLLDALARIDTVNQYVVYANRETGPDLTPAAANFLHIAAPVRAVHRPTRILYEQIALPHLARRDRIDVLFNPGFTAPALCPCPQVTVIHDLQHKRHPEHFRWFDLPFWRLLVWTAVHRSRRLIAVSEATRDDLLRTYRVPAERIAVVPHGVDPRFFEIAAQRREPEPVLLCVSTLHPHKNLERLVRVFAQLRAKHPRWRLVLAGMKGFHAAPVERLMESLSLGDAVRITGWIPREELYEWFRRAGAFVYPSTFEGFGMPVLEALAADIPTACSSIEPLRSIAADAALLFPPEDDGAMYGVLDRLLSGERAPMDGPSRAREFSWEAAARATLDTLRRAGR